MDKTFGQEGLGFLLGMLTFASADAPVVQRIEQEFPKF